MGERVGPKGDWPLPNMMTGKLPYQFRHVLVVQTKPACFQSGHLCQKLL